MGVMGDGGWVWVRGRGREGKGVFGGTEGNGGGRGEGTWMRFLPSGLVTRGWSLGVVKV